MSKSTLVAFALLIAGATPAIAQTSSQIDPRIAPALVRALQAQTELMRAEAALKQAAVSAHEQDLEAYWKAYVSGVAQQIAAAKTNPE